MNTGAMRGARVVSNELHGLMWKQPDGRNKQRPIFTNQYAYASDPTRTPAVLPCTHVP